MGVRVEDEKRRERKRKKRERRENETNKKKEVRVGWHLLRHLTFFWVLIFLHRVSLLLSLSLSQPLRHSASLSKFLFILYIFCPIPRFWFPICRHQWAG